MTLKGYTVSKPINILSDDQVERIHYSTLEVLERTGVKFENDKALEILEGAVEDEDWARAWKKALDKLWRWWMR